MNFPVEKFPNSPQCDGCMECFCFVMGWTKECGESTWALAYGRNDRASGKEVL